MNLQRMILRALLCFALGAVTATASAHHAFSMFEWGKEKVLEGTVVKWEWTQPHTFIWVNVKDKKGKVQKYGLEGPSPSILRHYGWSKRSLAHGDEVKVSYYPLRDGRAGGFYIDVTLANGRTLQVHPQRAPK